MSLVGSYVALRINPKAMVAEYGDGPVLAVASALGTRRYVALVVQIPSPPELSPARSPKRNIHIITQEVLPQALIYPGWRTYRLAFLGRHDAPKHPHDLLSSACVAALAHDDPTAVALAPWRVLSAVRPSRALPFPAGQQCCHWVSLQDAFVRVHEQSLAHVQPLAEDNGGPADGTDHARAWTVAERDVRKLLAAARRCEADRANVRAVLPPPAGRIRRAAAVPVLQHPRPAQLYPGQEFGVLPPAAQGTSLNQLADLALAPPPLTPPPLTPPPPRTLSPADTAASASGSELFERVHPRLDDDAASVYSTDRETDATPASSCPTPSPVPFPAQKAQVEEEDEPLDLSIPADMKAEDAPFVDVSLDLGALEDVASPDEFFMERKVVMQLVQKAKDRQRNELTSPSVTLSLPERAPRPNKLSKRARPSHARAPSATSTLASMSVSMSAVSIRSAPTELGVLGPRFALAPSGHARSLSAGQQAGGGRSQTTLAYVPHSAQARSESKAEARVQAQVRNPTKTRRPPCGLVKTLRRVLGRPHEPL
ncbi:uncharacterized protein BXZ73DRAFT_74907 [Epithele typhae]|uniref:uncharacterized protein n=1 Tax=Epithele typhae TaxID=378194 RepID=UPI00200795B6|nr:uncharacterized protein BXZ73DRAFT_74907 [Epithele typhae]KAH9941716.1 hypothetical protein BXZ73DRAFT_74907 [Epithele typhae]